MEAHHTVQALIFGSYSASFGSKGDQTTELAACKTLGFTLDAASSSCCL